MAAVKALMKKQALEFVNHIRVDHQGREPLDELPKGVPGDQNNCPIARGINHEFEASVTFEAIFKDRDGNRIKIPLDEAASNFIETFDEGKMPGLIDKREVKRRTLMVEFTNLATRKRGYTGRLLTDEQIDEKVKHYRSQLLVENAQHENELRQINTELDAVTKRIKALGGTITI